MLVFFIWVLLFCVDIYNFSKQREAILYFVIFLALILLDVHYFDAESTKMHKITNIFLKTDGGHFVFVFHKNCVKFQSTHNIQAYL